MGISNCFLICTLLSIAVGYPTGAPEGACDTMVPGHPPTTATGTPPFAIQLSANKYQAGTKLSGQIYSPSGSKFKGFLLQVRPVEGTQTPLGDFSGFDTSLAHTVCGKGGTQGLTHSNNTETATVNFTWTAPNQSMGEVRFNLTVVESYSPSVYWTGISSDVISPTVY